MPLVSDGAPDSDEALSLWPEVRLGAFVIVFEAAAEVRVTDPDADADADADAGAELDPDPELGDADDAEFTADGEPVLDCPIDPRTLLRLSDATAVVGCAEFAALDMSLPEIDGMTD